MGDRKNAYVIGLGKSGISAARLLQRDGWQVTIGDSKTSASMQQQQQELATEGIGVQLEDTFDRQTVSTRHLQSTDLVVVSPGVPWDIPGLLQARELGLETIGEIELAWRYLRHRPWVGITGTNGKTTTTALIAAIFQAAGFRAPACGNIGLPACDLGLSEPLPHWVIAELSSYQIESSASVAPRIGVWTTFTPDHLSRHKTLERYYNIKAHLLRQSQQQVFNGDDPYLRQAGLTQWPDACWTSVTGKANLLGDPNYGVYIEEGWVVALGDRILPADALNMPGAHNLQNLLMAVATARLAGIETDAILEAISTFPGVPHRLERICTVQGVDYINDSKATNYDAAQVGLASVESPAILIAGGEAKQGEDAAWLQTIRDRAAAVLLIGSSTPAFAQRLQEVGYATYEAVETMERAVPRSAELAAQLGASVVLLSPACASFDQYQNFEQRGDHFRQLCLDLLQ
ncbi:UDP-N-acetylmuramoylalanine--D-glutamate ligase [Leptolyngbya sp. 'hensonii']|uniref:UDP-N-acetylmuramoyl-L-alanine--D-glutamate ligase n=1 Tax=Leptolyngbya sp. 'hensonii' TaxID=1922337 RepID=UPI00095020D5|nr:UDP-N-acetylmuramoyl-L-alanine--D-glutamate ligase [Leptolyngbya sp. 'hensonii']OLP16391.1 UDP-N-acetylmuramoylalanine--D-glutamate ligase [Leptolyngbya sp. 'hensonii']